MEYLSLPNIKARTVSASFFVYRFLINAYSDYGKKSRGNRTQTTQTVSFYIKPFLNRHRKYSYRGYPEPEPGCAESELFCKWSWGRRRTD
jgi:hypothetical protein